MKKLLTHWTFAFVTLFTLTWIGLQDPQVKEILRLKSFDLLFQSQEKEISQDIAIIEIDEKAIEIYGQWPWKRDVLANLIEELRAAEVGVAKIGNPLDWLFSWKGMVGPIESIGQNAAGVGTTNISQEIDGVVRRMPLIMKIGDDVYPSLAIEVIRVAIGESSYQVKAGDGGIIAMRVPGFATIKTDANARME